MADATKLNYQDNSFDAVFDYGAIHHIPSPQWKKCLKEIYRVLKPAGKVFLYDLPTEAFDTIWGKITKLFTTHPYGQMYRKKEFNDCLKLIGFNIIKYIQESRYFIIVAKK
jgi:ubiquinone/menaquinone biosynthesis C-methylase UbiE